MAMFKKVYDFMIAVAALMFAGALLANNARAGNFDIISGDLNGFFASDHAKDYCPQFGWSYKPGEALSAISTVTARSAKNANAGKPTFSVASEDSLATMVVDDTTMGILDNIMPIATLGTRYTYALVLNDSPLRRIDDLRPSTKVVAAGDIALKAMLYLTAVYPTKNYEYKPYPGIAIDALQFLDSYESDVLFVSSMTPDIEFMKLDESKRMKYRLLSLDAPMENEKLFNRRLTPKSYASTLFVNKMNNVVASKNVLYTSKLSYVKNEMFYLKLVNCLINNEGRIKAEAPDFMIALWREFSVTNFPSVAGMSLADWRKKWGYDEREDSAPTRKPIKKQPAAL